MVAVPAADLGKGYRSRRTQKHEDVVPGRHRAGGWLEGHVVVGTTCVRVTTTKRGGSLGHGRHVPEL